MDLEEVKVRIEKWNEVMKEIDCICDGVGSLFGNIVDSKVFNAIAKIQEEYTKAISASIEDEYDTLEWYWLENKMGEMGLSAGSSDNMKSICNISDLAYLIEHYKNLKGE